MYGLSLIGLKAGKRVINHHILEALERAAALGGREVPPGLAQRAAAFIQLLREK